MVLASLRRELAGHVRIVCVIVVNAQFLAHDVDDDRGRRLGVPALGARTDGEHVCLLLVSVFGRDGQARRLRRDLVSAGRERKCAAADHGKHEYETGANCRYGLAADAPRRERVPLHREHDASDLTGKPVIPAALRERLAGRYGAVLFVGFVEGVQHRRDDASGVLVGQLGIDRDSLAGLGDRVQDVLLSLLLGSHPHLGGLALRLRLAATADVLRPVQNLGLIDLGLVILKVLILLHVLYPFCLR